MVIIIAIIAIVFVGFLLMNVIQQIQASINPQISETAWIDDAHYTVFYYASTFITNIWTYIIAIGIFILAYWAWTYSQRHGAGY